MLKKIRSRYFYEVDYYREFVKCTYCDEKLLPKYYTRHIRLSHKEYLHTTRLCVWCMDFVWKERGDSTNFQHRIDCFRNRCKREMKILTLTSIINKLDMSYNGNLGCYLNCIDCDIWHKSKKDNKHEYKNLPDLATMDIPISEKWLNAEFSSVASNVQMDPESGIDGYWMNLFLEKDYIWFHSIIRLAAWDSFYLFALNNSELFGVMPYWCLCDFGTENIELHNRHNIVFMEVGDAQNYKKMLKTFVVTADNKHVIKNDEGRHIDLKYSKQINTVKHFMNAWRFVSNSNFNEGRKKMENRNHYYIAKPMIPHCLLGMAMYFPKGFQTMTEILKMSIKINGDNDATQYEEGKWSIPFKEAFNDLRNHIPPVLRTTSILMDDDDNDEPMSKKLKLNSFYYKCNDKQYFKIDSSLVNLNTIDYNRFQLERGHAFIDMIADYPYTLNKLQNYILDNIQ